MLKQIAVVFHAVKSGYDTSVQIAEHTSMPVDVVSTCLTELRKAELIVDTGRIRRAERGPPAKVYEVAKRPSI